MDLNLKKVFDAQEFNRFMSLLKDVAPYQMKLNKANGCAEMQNKDEKKFYNNLKMS